MPGSFKYLDPKVLNKLSRMEVKARLIVEGFISGMHRSPYRGFSVEFAEHREYVPGDDLRHVDWKVWSKTDKHFVKQYEEETNLNCWICLDTSESMAYGSPGAGVSKLEYGSYIAAVLTYLLIRQGDAVGLALFDNAVKKFLPLKSHPSHILEIAHALENVKPDARSDIEPIFHVLAEKMRTRGLVLIISDLFNPVDALIRGFKHLRHKRHDVLVFHVLDPYEKTFPFQRMTLFEGLEGLPELLAEPRTLRDEYLTALADFQRDLRAGCTRTGIDCFEITTDQKLDVALSAFLARRMGK